MINLSMLNDVLVNARTRGRIQLFAIGDTGNRHVLVPSRSLYETRWRNRTSSHNNNNNSNPTMGVPESHSWGTLSVVAWHSIMQQLRPHQLLMLLLPSILARRVLQLLLLQPTTSTSAQQLQLFHPRPDRVWLLDTVPGIADASVLHVLAVVKRVVAQLKSHGTNQTGTGGTSRGGDAFDAAAGTSRDAMASSLQHDHGLSEAMAKWLAAQFQVDTAEFNFDIDVAEALAQDFENHDFWEQLDRCVTVIPVHLVQGGKNLAWKESLPRVLEYAAQNPHRFRHHVLPNAGHWVHADDLPGLLAAYGSV
jgi:pimeloyl-ACP methyl ester carboxylesterase